MKDFTRQAAPARSAATFAAEKGQDKRITLALLDAYTARQESRGYDPYNAGNPSRAFDAWRSKSKRR
jgi:hypothetical protein